MKIRNLFINLFSSIFSRKKTVVNPNRMLVYADKKGNRWYVYNDPLQMHISRKLELEDSEAFLTMNLTREWLLEHCRLMNECLNSGKIVDAIVHETELEARLRMNWSREALIHFCISYYMINDEPDEPSPAHYLLKKELVLGDSDLQSFFLDDVFKRYKLFTQDLQHDFLTYSLKIAGLDKATFNHSLKLSIPSETNLTKPV